MRPLRVILACAFLVASGCVGARPIPPGTVPELGPGEGILVVDIETAVPIEQLLLSRATAAEHVDPGHALRMIVVRAGEYRWSGLRVPSAYGIIRYRVDRDEEWALRVVPGRINYPGTLVIHKGRNAIGSDLRGRVENRSARTWLELKRRTPELLARYRVSYTGPEPDAFLAELEKVRAAHPAPPAAAAVPSQ